MHSNGRPWQGPGQPSPQLRSCLPPLPRRLQTTTTTTAGAGMPVATGEGSTISAEHFTKVEDRPVVKERVELVQEHRPVEKEFVVRQGRGREAGC